MTVTLGAADDGVSGDAQGGMIGERGLLGVAKGDDGGWWMNLVDLATLVECTPHMEIKRG